MADVQEPLNDAAFLSGGGETGALMRMQDWSASPLGPPADWPQSLRSVVGLLLGSKFPMFVAWGSELGFLYNDAYAEILGSKHPQAMGRRFRKIWAEIWSDIAPLIDAAMDGEATYRENLPLVMNRKGYDEQTWFTFSYSPVRDETGRVAGMFCAVAETTGTVLAEHRQAFLVSLGDALRDLVDPVALTATAAGLLGQHLGAGRAGYGDIDADGEIVSVARDWTDGALPSLAGEARVLDAFGPEIIAELKAGRTLVVEDCRTDARASRPEFLATWESIGTRSLVVVPLVGEGRLLAILYVHSAAPRVWSDLEVRLAEDVGGRTWAAVERARAEERLRDSEGRFRLMADAVPQIVWITDAQGRAEFFNRQWFDYTGSSDEAMTAGQVAANHVHPEDAGPTVAAFEEAKKSGSTFLVEHRIRSADGAYRWFLVRGEPYRDGDGDIVRWFGASVDIQDRKIAEDRLRELNATLEQRVAERTAERNMLATLVEMTDVMVMAADLEYNILGLNTANADEFERLYGVRPEAGDNMLALLAGQPEHQEQVRASWARGMRGDLVTFVEEFGDTDRPRSAYEISFRPLRNETGQQIGVYQFVTDVTDRLRSEAQLAEAREALRQSQKMEAMGQLTGGVAHDFNNLLTPIVGSLDMLQRRGLGGEREQRMIAGAMQSAERARTLVQRLLAFARRQPLQAVAVNIADLVMGMGDLISSTTGPQIKVELDVAQDLPPARADLNQLEMALLNLAVNARDAMPEGGTLRIGASSVEVSKGHRSDLPAGAYVLLSVADDGAGMDEATIARAIEPFFSTKGVGKGTGLGLSMVHGLASQLRGALTIQSRLGLGTTVELWLPQSHEAPERPDAAVPDVMPSPRRGKVLLVDDEELVRLSTADILADLGYSVVEAGSGEEAVRILATGEMFDVLLTDHLMPGMTGTELASAVRASRPEIPVLLVSGYAEGEGIEPNLPRLTKPFRKDELAFSLRQLSR